MMNIKLKLLIFILSFTYQANAMKLEGEIIFENDTVSVTFFIPVIFFSDNPNFIKLQHRVKYFDKQGEKHILKPDDAQEIQFTYKNEKFRMLSRYNSIGYDQPFSSNKNIFLKLDIDGELKMFTYYYLKTTMNGTNGAMSSTLTTEYILEKMGEELFSLGSNNLFGMGPLRFKNEMKIYLSDCSSLVNKIESKQFRKRDIETIVKYYNTNCN